MSYSPADEHHQWQRDNGDTAPLSSTTSHHHDTGAAAATVTPKEHHHHEPAAVAAKEAVTPAAAEPTTSTTPSSSSTAAPSTTVDAPPANAERTPSSLSKTDSHTAPAATSTTDAAPDAAEAKPDDGEYHGEHAGKLGYGPQAPSGGGLPDRLKAMEEKIKGKLTHNPELVQQAHERDTGELAEKRRQYDASHDDGAFSKPAEDDKSTPAPDAAAGAKDDKKVADDVRESGHAAKADAATASTKSSA